MSEATDYTEAYRNRFRDTYIKTFKYPEAEVPLWFWSSIVAVSSKSKKHKCLESNLEELYDSMKNKKTYRKYITTLIEADAMLRIGRFNYMLNPEYVHKGAHTSTEQAKANYDRERQAQQATGGKTPWKHGEQFETAQDAMSNLVKRLRLS